MEEAIKKIEAILNEMDESVQKEILIECTAKIGTKEWADDVKDLWERMKNL